MDEDTYSEKALLHWIHNRLQAEGLPLEDPRMLAEIIGTLRRLAPSFEIEAGAGADSQAGTGER